MLYMVLQALNLQPATQMGSNREEKWEKAQEVNGTSEGKI